MAIADIPQILAATSHRPWPLPERPWIMFQRWNDLLFAHWALSPSEVRPLVPQELELDLFEGKAWVAITPFRMSHVRLRGMPPLPGTAKFPEMNLRTYVRLPDASLRKRRDEIPRPGVFFFSLDAGSVQAVLAARLSFGLPYFWAEMSAKVSAEGLITYESRRRQRPKPAEVKVTYRPTGLPIEAKSDLEIFLTERYCLYVVRRGRIYRAEIQHIPWPLQAAEARFEVQTLASASGVPISGGPRTLHFSRTLDVLVFPPSQVR